MTQAVGQGATVAVLILSLLFSLRPAAPVGVWVGTGLAAMLGLSGTLLTARRELIPLLRPTATKVGIGLLSGVVMAIATHLIYPLAVTLWPAIAPEAADLYGRLDAPPGKRMALPIMAAVVVAEELVFRGLAYGQLRKRFSRPLAIAVAVLLYAVPQLASGSWLLPMLAIGCGLIWTWQRAHHGNLVVPTVTHLTWDLLAMVLVPLPIG